MYARARATTAEFRASLNLPQLNDRLRVVTMELARSQSEASRREADLEQLATEVRGALRAKPRRRICCQARVRF